MVHIGHCVILFIAHFCHVDPGYGPVAYEKMSVINHKSFGMSASSDHKHATDKTILQKKKKKKKLREILTEI